jgi:hypothetical protein
MPKFEVQGMVERIPGAHGECSSMLANGGIVKSAASADELRAGWLAAMKQVFGEIGPDYNIEFHCNVTPVPDTTPEGPVFARMTLRHPDPPPTRKIERTAATSPYVPYSSRRRQRGLFRRLFEAMFAEAEM